MRAGAGFFRATLCATVCVAAIAGRPRRAVDGRDPRRRLCPPFRARGTSPVRRVARPGRHFRQCAGDAEGARPDRRLCAHRSSRRYASPIERCARCNCARSKRPIVCSSSAGCGATGLLANSIATPAMSATASIAAASLRSPTRPTMTLRGALGFAAPAPRSSWRSAGWRSARTRFASSASLSYAAPAASIGAAGDRGRRFAA